MMVVGNFSLHLRALDILNMRNNSILLFDNEWKEVVDQMVRQWNNLLIQREREDAYFLHVLYLRNAY